MRWHRVTATLPTLTPGRHQLSQAQVVRMAGLTAVRMAGLTVVRMEGLTVVRQLPLHQLLKLPRVAGARIAVHPVAIERNLRSLGLTCSTYSFWRADNHRHRVE